MTPEQEAQEQHRAARGDEAKRLLENKLFLEAVAALQDDIWRQFKSTDASDAQGLQRVKQREELLVDFVSLFRRHVETGDLAKNALQRWADKFKRKTR